MKAALNGVLNFSIQDGWWMEGYKMNPMAGWSIGPDDSDPNANNNDGDIDANHIYELIEKEIIPTYMNHDDWIYRQKNAIALAAYFNTHRMMQEYAEKAYRLQKQKPWKYNG
jgi:starch phosphorylase